IVPGGHGTADPEWRAPGRGPGELSEGLARERALPEKSGVRVIEHPRAVEDGARGAVRGRLVGVEEVEEGLRRDLTARELPVARQIPRTGCGDDVCQKVAQGGVVQVAEQRGDHLVA